MEIAVTPDGVVYWIELTGQLKSFNPKTSQAAVVGELKITTAQENGLIGLALDPDFARTGWVFLQYSPPDFPGQHISRFTIRDGKLDLSSEKLLLKYEEQRKECCHHAGSLHFGPRGELFIATGDNTHPHGDSQGYAPIDERPDVRLGTPRNRRRTRTATTGKSCGSSRPLRVVTRFLRGICFPATARRGVPRFTLWDVAIRGE